MTFPAPPVLHVLHVPGAMFERDEMVASLYGQAEVCVHTDPDRLGVVPNWLSALECVVEKDRNYLWSVIVQDDAQPLRGWQQHLERACMNSPQPALGLSHFGSFGQKAVEKSAPYAEGSYLMWGAAIAYHRSIREGLWEWASRVYRTTGYKHDDVMVAAYMAKLGHKTAMTSRAIFDQPITHSLLGHNTPIRRPNTTIENSPEISYKATPRAVPVARQGAKKDIERLVAL